MIDLVIVGGGVAAAAAVISLRESGRSIRVITPSVDSGADKIGESLSPSANPTLKKLGLWDDFRQQGHRESQSSFSAWGMAEISERSSIGNLEGPGWQIDRNRFESLLWKHADQTPYQRVNSTVSQATHAGGRWQITTGEEDEIEAAFILDCSGRSSVVARQFSKRERGDRQLAAYAFLSQHDQGISPTPGSLIESRPDAWWYSALLPDGRMVIVQFFDADLMSGRIHKSAEGWASAITGAEFTERRIRTAGFLVEGLPKIADASTSWLAESTGDQWAAAGDAASAFDPLSSHGMTTALWSGRRSALAIDQALSGDRAGIARYSLAMREGVMNFLEQRRKIYGMENRFKDQEFWQRRM